MRLLHQGKNWQTFLNYKQSQIGKCIYLNNFKLSYTNITFLLVAILLSISKFNNKKKTQLNPFICSIK